MQDLAPTCQLWPPTSSRLSRGARKCATALAVSVGRRRSTCVCGARAPCRAGCGRFTPYESALYQREASLPRCKTVLRRGSCSLQRAAGFRVAHASAPLRWLSVGRRRSMRACEVRAPCCAGCNRSMPYGRTLYRREAFLLRRKTVLQRASCGLYFAQPAFALRALARLCAVCLWREGAARAPAACVWRAARAVVAPFQLEEHRTSEKPLSFSARPCSNVPAAAFTSRSRLSLCVRWRASALSVCGEKAQHARLLRACGVPRGLWSFYFSWKSTATARSLSP